MDKIDTSKVLLDKWTEISSQERLDRLQDYIESSDITLIPVFVDLLENEKDRAVKERLLMILNELIPRSDYDIVDRMLRSPDPFIRNGVVEIIKKSEIPLIEFLGKLAEDPDKDVRKFVIDSLSTEKSEEAINIIRRRLVDADPNVVYTAVEYLGNFRDTEKVEEIEEFLFLDNVNLMLTCSSLEALSKINQSPRAEEIIKKFSNADTNPMLLFPLLRYLSTFGSKDAFILLEKLLDGNPEPYMKEIIDAIEGIMRNNGIDDVPEHIREKLESIAKNTDNSVNQYEISRILSAAESEHSIEKIREMLNDENEMVQIWAVEQLGLMGDESDIELLDEIAEETESDEMLEVIGDAVMKIDERINQ